MRLSPSRSRRTIGRTLSHSLRRSVGSTLGLIAGFMLVAFLLTNVFGLPTVFQHEQPSASTAPAVDPVRELINAHDCWMGSEGLPPDMVGKIPGHVIVTVDGHLRYGGRRLVNQALEQIFEDIDHGLTVHAFCR